MIKRYAKHTYRIFLRIGICFSVFLAILILSAYLFINRIHLYKTALISLAKEQLNADLSIQDIKVLWKSWQPLILLTDTQVIQDKFSIEANQIRIEPNIIHSLLGLGLVFDYIYIDEIKLTIKEDIKKLVHPETKKPGITPIPMNHLLEQVLALAQGKSHVEIKNYFHIHDVNIKTADPQQKEMVSHAQITLFSEPDYYQLQLAINQPAINLFPAEQITSIVQVYKHRAADQIIAYTHIQDFNLTPLVHLLTPADSVWQQFKNLQGTTEFWYKNRQGQHYLYSQVTTNNLTYNTHKTSLKLADITGAFSWQSNKTLDQQTFQLHHLKLKQHDLLWEMQDLRINYKQQDHQAAIQAYSPQLSMNQALIHLIPWHIIPSAILPTSVSDYIHQLNPLAELRQVYWHGRLQPTQATIDQVVKANRTFISKKFINSSDTANNNRSHNFLLEFSGKATAKNLTIKSFEGIPAINNLDAELNLSYQDGITQGRLSWDDPSFQLHLPTLYSHPWWLEQNHGALFWKIDNEKRFSLNAHKIHTMADHIPIELDFSLTTEANMKNTSIQILATAPQMQATQYGIFLPDKVLSRSLTTWLKQATRGGEIQNTLFVYNDSVEKTAPTARTMIIAADLKNPEFQFSPNWPKLTHKEAELIIDLDKTSISAPEAQLSQLKLNNPFVEYTYAQDKLYVDTQFNEPQQKIINFLHEIPTTRQIKFLQGLSHISGYIKGHTVFHMKTKQNDPQFDLELLELTLNKVGFRQNDHLIRLENLSGQLHYDESRNIKTGRLLGKLNQEKLAITSLHNQLKNTIAMAVKTTLPETVLYQLDKQLKNYLQIEGESEIHIQFDWNKEPKILLTSNLQGIALNLPEPLNKSSYASQWITAETHLSSNTALQIHYYANQEDNTPLVSIYPELNPNEELQKLHLILPEIKLGKLHLHHIKSELKKISDAYYLTIDADRIQGQAEIRPDIYKIQLEKLILPRWYDQGSMSHPSDTQLQDPPLINWLKTLQPSKIPAIDLKIHELAYEDKHITHLQAHLQPEQHGLRLTEFTGALEHIQIHGGFFWSDQDQHQLQLSLQGEDIKELFQSITAKELHLDTKLSWNGFAFQPDIDTLEGQMQINMTQGHIITSDTGLNLLSLFGLLNINSLFRRLKLDFSDVTSTGLSFDRLKGEADIKNGILKIRDKFSIKGPSANLEFSGSTDLAKQTLNQRVAIILPVSESLPLTSILIGTPQIAGMVWLSSIVFSGLFNHFSGATYSITGRFDNPKLELEKLFDTNVLSTKERPAIMSEPK